MRLRSHEVTSPGKYIPGTLGTRTNITETIPEKNLWDKKKSKLWDNLELQSHGIFESHGTNRDFLSHFPEQFLHTIKVLWKFIMNSEFLSKYLAFFMSKLFWVSPKSRESRSMRHQSLRLFGLGKIPGTVPRFGALRPKSQGQKFLFFWKTTVE